VVTEKKRKQLFPTASRRQHPGATSKVKPQRVRQAVSLSYNHSLAIVQVHFG